MLFDQLLVARHVQQQVDDAVLLGDADATLGLGRRGRGQRQYGEDQGQAGAGENLRESVFAAADKRMVFLVDKSWCCAGRGF